MLIGGFKRFLQERKNGNSRDDPWKTQPLTYSWILSNRLAIGPMPRSRAHWEQLESAGFRSRFSCCYPEEERDLVVPEGWLSDGVALPDHRKQEPLKADRLQEAVLRAEALVLHTPPAYIHCMAGYERSPLLAVGLTVRQRKIDTFAALDWVRRCHPQAKPIYSHLAILDQILEN